MERGGPAQQFLDGGAPAAVVGALQDGDLVGMIKQCLHAEGDGLPGGLIPRHDQEQEHDVDLAARQRPASDGPVHERGDLAHLGLPLPPPAAGGPVTARRAGYSLMYCS